jgi:hypothetical protein
MSRATLKRMVQALIRVATERGPALGGNIGDHWDIAGNVPPLARGPPSTRRLRWRGFAGW